MIDSLRAFERRGGHPPTRFDPKVILPGRLATANSAQRQVLTRRDSPRCMARVMVAKWVCITHLKANWNR